MNITIEPFKASHVAEMSAQPAQVLDFAAISTEMLLALEQTEAWTTRVDGEVILVGGLVKVWDGRATMWSYVSAHAGPHMLRLTRGVKRFIAQSDYNRIEMYVAEHFEAGHRWAQMLGFRCEAENMQAFFPDGRNAALYARVR